MQGNFGSIPNNNMINMMNPMNQNMGFNINDFNNNMYYNQNMMMNFMTNWINLNNSFIQMPNSMSLVNNNMNQNNDQNPKNNYQTNFSNSDLNQINENKEETSPINLENDIIDFTADNQIQPKIKRSIKKIKKKQEKETVNIYYVPPFSLMRTTKFKIEIYKEMTLNQIAQEIQKRSDKRISTNLKFISVSNKECKKFLDPKKPQKDEAFIFSYEKEDRGDSNYAIPIYLCDSNKLSAYPRLLFFNRNTNYYEFKKKIHFNKKIFKKSIL